jgi:hypothetical protein
MYSQVLDSEFIPLVKNQVVSLPLPHEEFDINYVYQYWTPEINTTRRSDHAARFAVTWNSFFDSAQTISPSSANRLETPAVAPTAKVGNFLGAPASVLASNSIYALNKGLAINHTAIAGIVPVFNQLDVERLFNSELYHYQPTGGIFRNFKYGTEFLCGVSGLLTTASTGSGSYPLLVDLFFNLKTPQVTSHFCGDSSMYNWGQNIWSFYLMQPACRTSDTVTHISDTTSYFLGKFLAISTLRDQEILRLLRSANNYASGESSAYFLSLSGNKLR